MYQYFVPLTFQDFFLVAVDHFHFSFFWPLPWLEFVGFVLDTSSTVTSSVILEGKEVGFVLFSFFVLMSSPFLCVHTGCQWLKEMFP